MSADLFGFDERGREAPKGMCLLELHCHDDRDKSWLLSTDGDRDSAKFLPKSLGTRGEGRDENIWTVPTWKARELGWI